MRVWFAGCRAAVQLGHRKRGCGQANRGGFTSASASRAPGLHPRNEDLDAPCQERSESHECHTLKGIFHGGSPHPAPSLNIHSEMGWRVSMTVSCTSPKGVVQLRKRCPTLAGQPPWCDQISTLAKNQLYPFSEHSCAHRHSHGSRKLPVIGG